ncbi:MAG: GNAT family N-acetyltransferase [Gemmatimonadetes bacterium]|nr:GNAT family N-acetyltransferase [Gemmatimonadota bacterium]
MPFPVPDSAALATLLPAACRDKQGRPFTVRILLQDDRAALEGFYDAFEPKRGAQGLPPIGADRVARWLDSVLPDGVHLIAEAEAAMVGHGLLMPTRQDGVGEWAIFLAREDRGHGIGTGMNRIAVEVSRALGLRKLWLSVEPHNRAAVRSYEQVGFRFLPSAIFSLEAEMELELEL